jgi:hypothetical protein
MNKERKIITCLILALLMFGMLVSAGWSQDQAVRGWMPAAAASAPEDAPLTQHQRAKRKGMSGEEKLVRDVYARLMRYQTAAVDELATKSTKPVRQEDYLTFELADIHSGPIDEISGRPLAEVVTPRSGSVLAVKPTYLTKGNGPAHAYYEVEWTGEMRSSKAEATPDYATLSGLIASTGKSFTGSDRYTSYEVTVRLGGKQRTYRALVLHSQGKGSLRSASEIIDNVTSEMNVVLRDESPRVRSPWDKYVKTASYTAVAREISSTIAAGQPLISADAPIGYLPGDDVVAGASDRTQIQLDEPCEPPRPQLKLMEVGWSGTGQQTMKKTGSGSPGNDWENDTFFSEGDTTIANPVWIDANTDGTPNENEPIAYTISSSPKITGTKVTISPTLTTNVNAKVKVESGSELRFAVQDVVLTGSSMTLPDFSTSDNVGSVVNNRDYSLHWSVSFDNGQSFTEFGVSTHKVFVTIGTASGYLGNPGVTAKRIDYVTNVAKGKSDLVEIAQVVSQSVESNPGFSLNNFIPDNSPDHWKALDNGTRCDCISLSILVVKQLRMIGITASHGRSYPTGGNPVGDTDTGSTEFDSNGRQLVFYAAGGANVFEGFFEITDGGIRKAFTVDPTEGPMLATTRPVSGDRVLYSVIKTTLDVIRASDPSGDSGKQFWDGSNGIDFSTEVPFPVP